MFPASLADIMASFGHFRNAFRPEINLLCLPKNTSHPIPDLQQVKSAQDSWKDLPGMA